MRPTFSTLRSRFAIAAFISAAIAVALPAVASAAPEFSLTVIEAGSGTGTWECDEGSGLEPCAAEYPEGTELTVVAVEDPGSVFVDWSGDCGPLECELTMDEDHTATVTFELEEFILAVETVGSGSGTVECEAGEGYEECAEEYPTGTELILRAEPDPTSEFIEWSGDCDTVIGNECEVEMDAEKAVEASFEEKSEFALTIVEPGTGTGTVECEVEEVLEECAEKYPVGTELVVLATADPGSEFIEFGGDCGPAECELLMDEDHTVNVLFKSEGGPEPPTVTAVTPNKGTTAGGTAVTITGTNFTGATKVAYGSTEVTCTGVIATCKVESATEIKATTPAHAAGTVDVRVTTPGGTSAINAPSDQFTFETPVSPPTVTGVSPNKGTTAGGTAVTITGTNFTGATKVAYGSTEVTCTGVIATCKVESATEIKATTPAHAAGTVDVRVTTPGGTSAINAPSDQFTFETPVSPPTVTAVTPNKGTTAGGTAVTITGTNFTGATAVKFGSTAAASFEVKGATEVKATTPAHAAGEVDVTVTTPGGTSATGAADKFTFETPVVTHTLTINKAGSGSGSVTCNGGACASSYAAGTAVTLAASAASGSTFAGWSGAGCSGTGNCVVTLTADATVTATFNANPKGCPADPSACPPVAGTANAAGTAAVKSGKAALTLTCSGGPCSGTLQLTAKVKQGKKTKNLVIGQASFSLAAGASATLNVKLSGPAKQELAKKGKLKAEVTGTGIASSTVKLKPAAKKKHKRHG